MLAVTTMTNFDQKRLTRLNAELKTAQYKLSFYEQQDSAPSKDSAMHKALLKRVDALRCQLCRYSVKL
jgi:hypothetical protein